MVEPNYDGGGDTQNGNGGAVGTMGIQGELLKHFISADGLFGTVEGEMRNLVELLRTSPNAQHAGLPENRLTDAYAQFEHARSTYGVAQTHARYMADVGLNAQTLNIYDLIRIQDDCFRALGRGFYTGRPGPSPLVYPELSYDNPTLSEEEMLMSFEVAMEKDFNPKSKDFFKLVPMEVSGLVRMTCDLES